MFLSLEASILYIMAKDDKLPSTWTQRIRDEETLKQFEELKEELDDRDRKYGKQATGIFAIRLAYMKLQEFQKVDQEIDQALPE